MRKEYQKYVCNYIIFVCVIWLMVCVSPVNALTVTEYGTYTVTTYGHGITWNNVSPCYAIVHGYGHVDDIRNLKIGTCINNPMYCEKTGCLMCWTGTDWNQNIKGNINNGGYSSTGFLAECGSGYSYDGITESVCVAQYNDPTKLTTVTGTTCGVNKVEIYSNTYKLNEKSLDTSGDSYSFDIFNGTTYTLEFSDTHQYEFIGYDDIIYNYDICNYQILYYVDDCANLFKNPYIHIIKNDDWANWLISGGTSNTDVLVIGTDVELNDKLDVYIDTDQGTQVRTIYVAEGENTLFHSTKSWDLSVTVFDINTSAYVSGAKVCVDQDCRINDYAHLSCGTTNLYGLVKTFDLSNQNYRVKVEKKGYNTFGYQTISANFDAQTTNIPLRINLQNSSLGGGNGSVGDPDGDDTGTGGDGADSLPNTTCSIGWFSNDQKSISEINDTQDARLYFMAGNCSCELILESRDTVNHVWDTESVVPLTPKQTGYVQFTSANWTYPITKRYRGHLHGFSCGCDATDTLKVWDAADPNTTTIANLSCNVHFRYAHGSYINPSTPIQILSRAASNNTSLLNINLQLFNGTVKVDEISYTFFDYYRDSQFKSINWEPNYEFASGHRYCVYMYSNDILVDFDTVYANATDGNPFDTGNTLCVHVFDQSSMPLANSYVYVDGWDVKPTGTDNKVCFSGMPTDIYNYRATKPNYQDRGLSSVTMDVDKVVNYVLDKISDVHSVSAARLTNREIKSIYLPLMYLLFIMILLGGLQYVSK